MAFLSSSSISPLSLLLLIFLSLSSSPAISQSPTPSSVYDILRKYKLPSGLLPDCVASYSFNADDGSFVVELENSCYVQFDYLVYYEKRITGTLKLGSITNLNGIQVKRFLFWFDVDEIKVDLPQSDSIYFQVGLINKKLNIDQFQTIHSCTSTSSLSLLSRSSPSSKLSFDQLPAAIDDEIPMLVTE